VSFCCWDSACRESCRYGVRRGYAARSYLRNDWCQRGCARISPCRAHTSGGLASLRRHHTHRNTNKVALVSAPRQHYTTPPCHAKQLAATAGAPHGPGHRPRLAWPFDHSRPRYDGQESAEFFDENRVSQLEFICPWG
jgi:hypothetical protein